MDSRYRFLTLGTPWTQSMPSRDVNAVTRLAEASWWRDNIKCSPKSDLVCDVSVVKLRNYVQVSFNTIYMSNE